MHTYLKYICTLGFFFNDEKLHYIEKYILLPVVKINYWCQDPCIVMKQIDPMH